MHKDVRAVQHQNEPLGFFRVIKNCPCDGGCLMPNHFLGRDVGETKELWDPFCEHHVLHFLQYVLCRVMMPEAAQCCHLPVTETQPQLHEQHADGMSTRSVMEVETELSVQLLDEIVKLACLQSSQCPNHRPIQLVEVNHVAAAELFFLGQVFCQIDNQAADLGTERTIKARTVLAEVGEVVTPEQLMSWQRVAPRHPRLFVLRKRTRQPRNSQRAVSALTMERKITERQK